MENAESATQTNTTAPKKGGSKTPLILGIIVVLLLGLGGLFLLSKKNAPQSAQTANQVTTQNTASPTSASVFSSIKDALSKSVSLQCDYTDEAGHKTTAYIKAGAIRSDIVAANVQESGSVIMKDKRMYFWNGKQGMTMAFDPSTMTDTNAPKTQSSQSTQQNPGDFVNQLEKFKQNCKPAVIADSLFIPPADVKFSDVSEMMKAGTQKPSGTNGAMTQEQIKALQQQYQPPKQ